MAFRVILTDPALMDIEEAMNYIWVESPVKARLWLADFWWVVDSLKEMPFRHTFIPEAEAIGIKYRSFPLYSHRLIYRVDEVWGIVYIVRVYHSARKPLKLEDLRQ